jgi:hypothetical protein
MGVGCTCKLVFSAIKVGNDGDGSGESTEEMLVILWHANTDINDKMSASGTNIRFILLIPFKGALVGLH